MNLETCDLKKNKKRAGKGRTKSKSRIRAFKLGIVLSLLLVAWGIAGEWYVHHPRQWLSEHWNSWPKIVNLALYASGNPLGDITDALGWTGHDVVYEYDTEAPSGSPTFAGVPVRIGHPAPADIRVLNCGDFIVGWSDTLRHPVWVAYHVKQRVAHEYEEKRPPFSRDHAVPAAPAPGDYAKTGFDRGHMAPNYAMLTRYGTEVQKKTFLMSNIAPQTPSLNRGVWRNVEHRIADLWTARYGEIWVVVGAIPSRDGEKLPCGVDVPDKFYQIIIAQEGMNVRALAMVFPRNVPYSAYAARNLASISEIEHLSGLNFNPELPSFIQDPLEQEVPDRLWPIRFGDIFKMLAIRYR